MYKQIIEFAVQPDQLDAFKHLLNRWSSTAGARLDGCRQIETAFELDGDRVTVAVLFDDREALERFSSDEESLEMFEHAKPLLADRLAFYEAVAEVRDLT